MAFSAAALPSSALRAAMAELSITVAACFAIWSISSARLATPVTGFFYRNALHASAAGASAIDCATEFANSADWSTFDCSCCAALSSISEFCRMLRTSDLRCPCIRFMAAPTSPISSCEETLIGRVKSPREYSVAPAANTFSGWRTARDNRILSTMPIASETTPNRRQI